MTELGLRERMSLLEDLKPFQRMWVLDGLWTNIIRRPEILPEGDYELARSVLEELAELFGQCSERAESLRQQLRGYPDVVSEAVNALLAETPPAPDLPRIEANSRHYWQHMLDSCEGEGARLADLVFEGLASSLPAEQTKIREQSARLGRGESLQGDMMPRDYCYLFIGYAIIGGAVGAWPFGIFMAGVAGQYCGEHRVFNGDP